MDLQTIAFLFGAVLVAVAILGGGFEIKEIKIPKVHGAARVGAAIAGLLFVTVGTKDSLSDLLESLASSPVAPTPDTLVATNSNARMPADSESWFVQFGVFNDRPNAEIELKRLQDSGITGLRIVGAQQFPGLSNATASYLVLGPISQSAASEFLKKYTLKEPRPYVRNAFVPPPKS